jgi:hypothetical protein
VSKIPTGYRDDIISCLVLPDSVVTAEMNAFVSRVKGHLRVRMVANELLMWFGSELPRIYRFAALMQTGGL